MIPNEVRPFLGLYQRATFWGFFFLLNDIVIVLNDKSEKKKSLDLKLPSDNKNKYYNDIKV